jgi:hypothetical protein
VRVAVSPYWGTPVADTPTNHSLSSSLASANPTKKSLPRLTEKDRRQHLKKYNKLIKAGYEKSDTAAETSPQINKQIFRCRLYCQKSTVGWKWRQCWSANFTQTFLFLTHASASALRNCAADNSLYISSSTAVMSSGSSATMICFQSLSSAFFCLEWRSFSVRYHSPPWSMISCN